MPAIPGCDVSIDPGGRSVLAVLLPRAPLSRTPVGEADPNGRDVFNGDLGGEFSEPELGPRKGAEEGEFREPEPGPRKGAEGDEPSEPEPEPRKGAEEDEPIDILGRSAASRCDLDRDAGGVGMVIPKDGEEVASLDGCLTGGIAPGCIG